MLAATHRAGGVAEAAITIMDSGFPFLDIIFLAMVAGFLALRLRSVLGRRTGDESGSADSQRSGRDEPTTKQTRIGRDREQDAGAALRLDIPAGSRLARTLTRIADADSGFDVETFLTGAQAAYRMIIEAFAAGDRDTLRGLLNDDVYAKFEAAIAAREAAHQTMESRVVRLERAEIESARLNSGHAEVSVRLQADLLSVTRDSEGRVVDGNPSDAELVVDIWSFAREAGSPDPNWRLVATRSETG